MGFLPKLQETVDKITNKILDNRFVNSAFCLFLPGQLFARHNYLNSNYSQYLYLYLPFFWFPPLSLIPFMMMLNGKFRVMPRSNKITLTDIFAWILITIFSFVVMVTVPMLADSLMSENKLGRLIDMYIPSYMANTVASAVCKTLIGILLVYIFTLIIESIKYHKKCRKQQQKTSTAKLFKASLIPTAAAAVVLCATNFLKPVKDIIISMVLSLVGIQVPEGAQYIYNIPIGILMALLWTIFAQYNVFLSCAR